MINISDFNDFLEDNRYSIEERIDALEHNPNDLENIKTIKALFQEISKKATEHEIIVIEELNSALENICHALLTHNFAYHSLLNDIMLLTIDHLFDYTKNLIEPSSNFDTELTNKINISLISLSQANNHNLQERAQHTLNTLTSQLLIDEQEMTAIAQAQSDINRGSDDIDQMQRLIDHTIKTEQDLLFFRSLIRELEQRFPAFNKRGERILPIALAMNKLADEPVNPTQLEAAIYLHDVGMAFIPDTIMLKTEKLDDQEKRVLERHPIIMAALLNRMEEWEDAAIITHQHHEKMDGSGYPQGLHSDKICDGAKILAIMDAFDAMTHARSDRSFKKTILRAVNEIIKNTKQFDANWTRIFIKVIKKHYVN